MSILLLVILGVLFCLAIVVVGVVMLVTYINRSSKGPPHY